MKKSGSLSEVNWLSIATNWGTTVVGVAAIYLMYSFVVRSYPISREFFLWVGLLFAAIAMAFSFSGRNCRVRWTRWLATWIRSWSAFFVGLAILAAIWYGCYLLTAKYAAGYLVYFRWGIYISVGINAILLVFNEPIVKLVMGAKRIKERRECPELWDAVHSATPWHARPIPRIYLVPESGMNAFSFGWGLPFMSAVGATDGIIKKLDQDELEAVMAHEVGHIINKDILISMAMTLTVMIMALTGWLLMRIAPYGGGESRSSSDSKDSGFLALLGALVIGFVLYIFGKAMGFVLQAFVSRQREYAADATASRIVGSSAPLKSALTKVVQDPSIGTSSVSAAVGFLCTADPDPDNFMSTHPSLENRLAALDQLEV